MKNKLNGISVLIVDDELELRELLGSQIEYLGASVSYADNGAQGYTLTQEKQFDVIFTDLKMVGGDGLSLLKNLRALPGKRIPLFLVTGTLDVSSKDAKDLGADGIITKPYEIEEIEAAILKVAQPLKTG